MKSCGKMRAGSLHVVIRHASVEVQVHCVNVVIGVLVVHVVLLVIRVVPVLLVMLWFISLKIIADNRCHCFHVAVSVAIFLYWRKSVYTPRR